MKILRKIISLLLLSVLCAGLLALPAAATTTTSKHGDLEVTVEMDKEKYDENEPITATITVRNTSSNTITIANLEQLIPEGYQLARNSQAAVQNIELSSNQTVVLEVTFERETPVAEEAAAQGFFDKLLYGQTMGIPNLLIVVVLVIAFVIFMILT